jgi:DNA-binding MarR family transcriptional regulator
MTSKQLWTHSVDCVLLKHISDERGVDVTTLSELTGLERWRVKQSINRLESRRQIERKKDDRGYVFVAAV